MKNSVYIILFFGLICSAQFECPRIEVPLNGATDVSVDTQVTWNKVGGINGYSVSLGTSPGASDILNSRSAALVNFLRPTAGLPDNTEIFVTISLFLEDGKFVTCPSESFTTVDITTPPECTKPERTASQWAKCKPGRKHRLGLCADRYRVSIGYWYLPG